MWHVGSVHSVVGVTIWAFLLRRPLLATLYHVFDWLRAHPGDTWRRPPDRVRRELRAARRVLPLAFGSIGSGALPAVWAQDAEGASESGFGGWGVGIAFPPWKEILRLLGESMGRGLPSGWDQEALCVTVVGWQRLTDSNIPETWADGTVSWHDVLART